MIFFHYMQRGWLGVAILALGLFLGGCGRNTAKVDISEFRNPLIQKARAKMDQGDQEGALACLNQALDKRSSLAQAHLDVGLLYDDFKKDYIRAIYHYQRYLELRPHTEKKDMIQDLIHKARMSFAASVSDQLPGYAEKSSTLQDENARLKNELREARNKPAKRVTTTPADVVRARSPGKSSASVDDTPPALSAVATGQRYRVQENDTLSRIAAKFYQNPEKWKLIYDANRGMLASPEKVRAGQVLIIPRRSEVKGRKSEIRKKK